MKTIKRTHGVVFCFVIFALLPNYAAATLWQLDFNGHISNINEYLGEIATNTDGQYNFHQNRFYIGQNFSGNIIIDDSALPGSTLANDPEKDIYSAVIDSYLDIGGYVYQKGITYPGYAQVWNGGEPNYYKDVFSAGGNTYDRPFDLGPGEDLSSFTTYLFDRDGDTFSSTSLIQTLTELSLMNNIVQQFEYANLGFLHVSTSANITNQYLFMDGDFATVTVSQLYAVPVPEPATSFLIGMGVIGLAAVGRRRKKG